MLAIIARLPQAVAAIFVAGLTIRYSVLARSYMCITVNGKRSDMSAGRKCEPAKWNGHAGNTIGTRKKVKSPNNKTGTIITVKHKRDTSKNFLI